MSQLHVRRHYICRYNMYAVISFEAIMCVVFFFYIFAAITFAVVTLIVKIHDGVITFAANSHNRHVDCV